MKKQLLILLLCSFVFVSKGLCQDTVNVYHWRYAFATDKKLSRRWTFLLKIDDRTTFIRNQAVDISGLQLGLQRKNWKFWLGYAYIQTPSKTRIATIKTKNNQLDSLKTTFNFNLRYGTFTPEYILYFHPRFEISTAISVGLGLSEFKRVVTKESNSMVIDEAESQKLFIPVEPVLKGVIRPTRWVGLSGSVGYRQGLVISSATPINYDGWFYAYGVSFFIGNIFQDMRRAWLKQKVVLN